MRHGSSHRYTCYMAGTLPAGKERGGGMLHPNFERELARERVAQMRTEVEHNRLEARLSRATVLSAEARLAKARFSEDASLRGSMIARGTSFVAALLR